MISISSILFYTLTFLSVYVQVFFLITFLENRKKIIIRKGEVKLSKYPAVTVIVPSWNEEHTVYKTVRSLLDLNYPKDKVKIFLVDDGSTDGTWNVMQKFSHYPNIKIFHKENGGKYTALNLGLENVETDFLGCLDADSIADPESLVRIMNSFEKNPDVMAVVPSMIVYNSKNIVQNAQKAEYYMGVFLKKMLGFMGAIHVTPGPLTIFRKKVFNDLGPYRHAHNTEDMEIAFRMQKHHYKIEHCNDAYVYTHTPSTVKNLFRQRLRWIYGFINNTIDYRHILFKKKYGNFSTFTVPAGIVSIIAVSYLFGRTIYNLGHFLFQKITQFSVLGFNFSSFHFHFDTFFINPQSIFFVLLFVYSVIIFGVIFGKKMANEKWNTFFGIICFFSVFGLVAPFWLMKAVYNTVLSRSPVWR